MTAMTQDEEYNHYVAMIEARRAGKEIEQRPADSRKRHEPWSAMEKFDRFNFEDFIYRVKPEPPKPREVWCCEIRKGNGETYIGDTNFRSKEQAEDYGEAVFQEFIRAVRFMQAPEEQQ